MDVDPFLDFVLDQLAATDGLVSRAMFGAHGLYRRGTFFAIVAGGRLYLKTDETTAGKYARCGMRPFHATEKQVLRTYYEVPGEVLESRDELLAWAAEAAARAEAAAALHGRGKEVGAAQRRWQ